MVDQITARELADRLDAGTAGTIVDTRPADSFAAWHLPDALNVPYDPDTGATEEGYDRVRDAAGDGPVTAICGKGLTSTPFAFELDRRGYEQVTVVKGGMEDWSAVYEVVTIADGDTVIRQLQRRGKGCLGYVVGSRSTGDAAVVDPTRQIEAFEVAAEEAGLTIRRVIDTHVHADHLSGGRRLADVLGVPYHLGEHAADRGVAIDFEPVADGDRFAVGDVELRAIHAPGHTSDMLAYRVGDGYLLSGDTLFVESVGRTELQFGEGGAADGARQLYDTLHDRLGDLPDETVVLPGHVSVGADSRFGVGAPGEPIQVRLGDLRERLELLHLDRAAFVERIVADAPEKPPNYERVIAINRGVDPVPQTEEGAAELELGPNNCAA